MAEPNISKDQREVGVRILANGWRLSERLQPKTKRRYFYQPEDSQRSVTSANRRLNACLPRPRSGPGSADRAEAKMPIKGTSLTRQPLYAISLERSKGCPVA